MDNLMDIFSKKSYRICKKKAKKLQQWQPWICTTSIFYPPNTLPPWVEKRQFQKYIEFQYISSFYMKINFITELGMYIYHLFSFFTNFSKKAKLMINDNSSVLSIRVGGVELQDRCCDFLEE